MKKYRYLSDIPEKLTPLLKIVGCEMYRTDPDEGILRSRGLTNKFRRCITASGAIFLVLLSCMCPKTLLDLK
jgi:hypothetical protein